MLWLDLMLDAVQNSVTVCVNLQCYGFYYQASLSSKVKPSPLVTPPRQVPLYVWLGQAALAALAHSSQVPLKKFSVAPWGAVKVHLAVPDVEVVFDKLPPQLVMGAWIPLQTKSSAICWFALGTDLVTVSNWFLSSSVHLLLTSFLYK